VSLFQNVDKRLLQHEIDTHRLFLLTSFHNEGASATEETAKEIERLASAMSFADQQQQVQTHVHSQMHNVAAVLDGILLEPPLISKATVPPNGARQRPSGLSFAVGVIPTAECERQNRSSVTAVVETKPLNRAQVATAFEKDLGFSLHVKQSTVAHQDAGTGLFISGRAQPGTVVSLYPGVIYSPSQYRYIPGYPMVAAGNPYLISRYDGLVIDGKPWREGEDARKWWDGSVTDSERALSDEAGRAEESAQKSMPEDVSTDYRNAGRAKTQHKSVWELVGGGKKWSGPLEGAVLELRNPLALGHFANHPPKGVQPNVMICSYTYSSSSGETIRPYIPNIVFGNDEELDMQRRGPLWVNEGRKDRQYELESRQYLGHTSGLVPVETTDVRTLVLVATRDLEDEELLLNYRLSNYTRQPSWYHSVDAEEERRRWD
jgi:hypothetical protein